LGRSFSFRTEQAVSLKKGVRWFSVKEQAMETVLAIICWPLGFLKVWAISRWFDRWRSRQKDAYEDTLARLRAEEQRRDEVNRLSRGSSEVAARYLIDRIYAVEMLERRAELIAEIERLQGKVSISALRLGSSVLLWRCTKKFLRQQILLIEKIEALELQMQSWERTRAQMLVEIYVNGYAKRIESLRARLTFAGYLCWKF